VPLAYRARELAARFTNIRGEWIRREKNEIADRLSKDALKKAGVKLRLQLPSTPAKTNLKPLVDAAIVAHVFEPASL